MSGVCEVCGLPEDICACENLIKSKQDITVSLILGRFRKKVTVVGGLNKSGLDLEDVVKRLRKKLACGGSISDKGKILLQGDHRSRMKKVLGGLGFDAENITVK